jgi:hypothetical protein
MSPAVDHDNLPLMASERCTVEQRGTDRRRAFALAMAPAGLASAHKETRTSA